MGGQLLRATMAPHDGLYQLIPIFGLTALISGTLNGLITIIYNAYWTLLELLA
jgi:hypothetical protein